MSQHAYVIPDELGAQHLATLNAVMQAIVTLNSGAAEPGTMYPYQFWADTTTGLLKQRNAANNAWVTVCSTANWALASVQLQASVAFTTAGTAPAYTVTTIPVLALAANQRLRIKFNQDNGGAASTLAKDGGATKAIKVYSPAGIKEDPNIFANAPYDLEYDGVDWVILNRTPITAAGFSNMRVYQRWNGTAAISGTTMTVSAHTSGALTIGSVVTGTGVSANTRVVSFGTYTPGGTGTLIVNNSQTVGSVAMASATAVCTIPSAKMKTSVQAGGGGGGGTAGGGGAGGASSFGSHAAATGGQGGGTDAAASSGGPGGVGSGGDLNMAGGGGGSGSFDGVVAVGGTGGSALFGGGGRAVASVGNISGDSPSGFGGGGSGGVSFAGAAGAGGGGGGGSSIKLLSGLTIGALETITIGAGGAAGASGGSAAGGTGAPGCVVAEW